MTTAYPTLCDQIAQALSANGTLILAIDGCCASGKTTLAVQLADRFGGDIVHMDDFFLPLFLRTPDRLSEPGSNVHYERVLTQIVTPLLAAGTAATAGSCADTDKETAATDDFCADTDKGLAAGHGKSGRCSPALPILSWERFDCSCGAYAPGLQYTTGSPFLIIEGAYCMRPELRSVYDETLFLTVSPEIQKQRILARNGAERWQVFRDRWIPMENRYFAHYEIEQACRLVIDNSGYSCE